MKFEDIKKLTKEDLEGHINDWKKQLVKLRIKSMLEKKAEKPHLFKELRKRIARAHTVRIEMLKGENS